VKRLLAVLAAGIGVPIVQGAVNVFVSPEYTPDLGFLVVIALGLHWRNAVTGLALAALIGFAADLLSGSLLGEQALLRMLAFACARVASGQLNLRGALPQVTFVLAFTAVNALGVGLLNEFFRSGTGFSLGMLRALPVHAAVNAVAAPFVSRGVELLLGAFADDESGRRSVRLPARTGAG